MKRINGLIVTLVTLCAVCASATQLQLPDSMRNAHKNAQVSKIHEKVPAVPSPPRGWEMALKVSLQDNGFKARAQSWTSAQGQAVSANSIIMRQGFDVRS